MAPVLFVRAILAGERIPLFNEGRSLRDFTYVDDVVESIVRLVDRPAVADPNWSALKPDPGRSSAPWRIYNIGNNSPVEVLRVVELLENAIGKKALRELLPMRGRRSCGLCRRR
jgi:UDP-glucuronate 4-epimerase